MGKTYTAKTPSGDFKVTTPENPLLSKQAITNKGIPVSYTNLQLNPYPNTQLDLFCSDNLSFQCTASSTWLTNCVNPSTRLDHQLEKDVGCKVLQLIQTMKILKLLGHKTLLMWTSIDTLWDPTNSIGIIAMKAKIQILLEPWPNIYKWNANQRYKQTLTQWL